MKENIREHIKQFPRRKSHYSRSSNRKREYLDEGLSISCMYRLYLDKNEPEAGRDPQAKEWLYRNIFNEEFNLTFGSVGPMFCLSLAQRLKEHKRALVNGHLAQSAVAEHAAQESHDIDWEGATVMDVQQQYHQRCLLESRHIRSELTTMNRDEGNLPPIYDLLIRQSHFPD